MDTYGLLLPKEYILSFTEVQQVSSRIFRQEVNGDFGIIHDPFTGIFNDYTLTAVVNKEVDAKMLPNIMSVSGMLYGTVVFCRLEPGNKRLMGLTNFQIAYLKRIKKLFLYSEHVS
ncbi:MAG: hypothetical protein AAFO04_25355 [Cyanobacteria bacterium J06592_8]